MTRDGWLLVGDLALGAAPAQAQTAANTAAPAPYEDRVIEGLAPLADENDGLSDYDRGGLPRYLRLETRLGNQAFDAAHRARLAYALDGLIETPNHGMLSVEGSVSPSPREQTLTLRQRALPLPGGWTGDHDLGVITAPATDLSRLPSRVLLPGTQLRGLGGQWEHTGQGLQLLAAGGEPGQLTSQPVTGFQGLGGRRHLAGAQWRSPGARATEPDGWTLALQHERATDVLTSATLDNPSGRTDADASHLALRRDSASHRSQAQLVSSRTGAGGVSAQGVWVDSEWDEGPRQHGLSLYRLYPGLSAASGAPASGRQKPPTTGCARSAGAWATAASPRRAHAGASTGRTSSAPAPLCAVSWYTKCITLWGTAVVVIRSLAAVYPVHAVIQPAIYRTGNRIFEGPVGYKIYLST